MSGQLENTETRERKWEREREGTPKTQVNIFDRAAHKAIVYSRVARPHKSLAAQLSRSSCPSTTDWYISVIVSLYV